MKPQSSVDRRTALGVYVLFLSVYLSTAAGHFFVTDHVTVFLTTQSLVEDHDLSIKLIPNSFANADGHIYAVYGPGQPVLSIPFYLLGTVVEHLSPPRLRAYWSGVQMGDWGGTVPIFFVSLFNQFVAPLVCLLVFWFGRQLGFSARRSLFVTLIFGFGTQIWAYSRDYFQHPLESLCLLSSVYVLVAHKGDFRPRHALLSGLLLSLGILTRVNVLAVAPLIAVYLFFCLGTTKDRDIIRRSTSALLPFSLPVLLAFGATLYLNEVRFGDYLTFHPRVPLHLRPKFGASAGEPIWLGFYGNLFSPGRSIFLYSPPIILSLFAYGEFYRRRRAEALLFLGIVLLYLIPYCFFSGWSAGWTWGPRLLFPAIPLLIIPTGYLFDDRRAILVAAFLAGVGLGVQILGVTVNYAFIYADWRAMHLEPRNAFLFRPEISPLVMHFKALLEQRHLDLWLLWVYRHFGPGIFLATVSVPVLLLGRAMVLLNAVNDESVPPD